MTQILVLGRDGILPFEFEELVSNLSNSPQSIVLLSTSKINFGLENKDSSKILQEVFTGSGSPVPGDT